MKIKMKKNIAYVFVILLVIIIGFFLFKTKSTDNGFVACTMEALICPDGSGVGRGGPSCEFSACSNSQESYLGGLVERSGEYYLVMVAPDTYHEVTYSMPLNLSRISNVLGTLVGKNVVVAGTFSSGNTLEVESIEEVRPL